jgi:hypothetical protein
MKKNTEMVPANSAGYLALRDFNLADMLAEEMSGLSASFERIKIPSGGGTVFEIPGDDSDAPETVREFSAVILYQHPLNAYYKSEYQGGSNPPDCGSFDGHNGDGDPGGCCDKCPLNQYGSGKNGAKACKNRRRLYLLREGEIFPMILSLPTGSLKGFTRYLMRVLPKYKNSNAVVTRFTLKKASSNTGIAYSQAQFAVDRALTSEEYALVSAMTEQVKALSAAVGYDTEESVAVVDPRTGEVVEPLA